MERIESGEVHLWLCFYQTIRDELLLNQYWGLLSGDERRQQRRFYFERDRRRYLVTRAMVRTVLSKYAPISPERWQFCKNAYGRPQIANEDAEAQQISFNLSHTNGLIVLGVTRERAIGVDVENVREQRAAIEIADRFFAPEELSALRALPGQQQVRRFFEYWTLKESYIKARGMGLSIPLDRFAFAVTDGCEIRLTIDSSLGDLAANWFFWQFCAGPSHLVAACVERSGSRSCRVRLRRTLPYLHELGCDGLSLRTTAACAADTAGGAAILTAHS